MKRFSLLLIGLALFLLAPVALAADFVWIESEDYASCSLPPTGTWDHQWLSGEWLSWSFGKDDVAQKVPEAGLTLTWRFSTDSAGDWEIWHRLGMEYVRQPFRWRVDEGQWHQANPSDLTVDLMELAEWTEVAWLDMGSVALSAGAHTLELNVPREGGEADLDERWLFDTDCFCLSKAPFWPNGKYKPGEDWRTDDDRDAEQRVYTVPENPAGQRVTVSLGGKWEIARDDELLPESDIKQPMTLTERPLFFYAVDVPGDKAKSRPDFEFAHRVWYRTRLELPADAAGKACFLTFPGNNLNTTIYLNGKLCGFNAYPMAAFSLDLSPALKPGPNELLVGIRDAYYGFYNDPSDPLRLRKRFNIPRTGFQWGFLELDYPIWNCWIGGLIYTPTVTLCPGPAWVENVFVKPSVAKHQLDVEVTLANPQKASWTGQLTWESVDEATGQVAQTFPAQQVSLPAGQQTVVSLSAPWADAKLWWPDAPQLYTLRVSLDSGVQIADASDTRFGFREWSLAGKDFLLNGLPWHGWADVHRHSTREEWLDFYQATNQRFVRLMGAVQGGLSWYGMTPPEALNWFDENGIIVRRSGICDGEACGYQPSTMTLAPNLLGQAEQWVRSERNHPSIQIWSLENELMYINMANLGQADNWEPHINQLSQSISALDPTRPNMLDGGGAMKAQIIPVHGDHYTTGAFPQYPTLAYEANATGGGKGIWHWDEQRPRYIGEEIYSSGINPGYAYLGGESVFLGKEGNLPAVGLFSNMLTQGYRWYGIGAWHFWNGQHDATGQYKSFAPQAVFCRQWHWTFGSGQQATRMLGLFNDTRFDDPMTLTWSLTVAGKQIAEETKSYSIAPGTKQVFEINLPIPKVTQRTEGVFLTSLAVKGEEVYRDEQQVTVLAPQVGFAARYGKTSLPASEVFVLDPEGTVGAYLEASRLKFTPLASLDDLPDSGKLLIVGRNALSLAESTSSRLAAWALASRSVIVLEQEHPLKYQGLPAEMEAQTNDGRVAWPEDPSHVALRDLTARDFFTWAPDEVVYRNAWQKPVRGAKSLIQCHEELKSTALVEVPVGPGLMLLSQLAVEETLPHNVVAKQLLLNLVEYGAAYKLAHRQVAACTAGDESLKNALDALGLQYEQVATPLAALAAPDRELAIIAATPAHLKALADASAEVARFTDRGGWIVLHGLTPEGLADYNRLVGFDHMIRPFKREKFTFPALRNPLTAGLTLADVVMYGPEQIFGWAPGNFIADDIFSYVVDYDEVASFAQFDNDFVAMMTNGMVSADAWKYIVNVDAPDNPPLDFNLKLPKSQTLTRVEWTGNTFYYPVTHFELIADGKPPVGFEVEPTNAPQTFDISPILAGQDFVLRLARWEKLPGVAQVTGLDNLRLWAERPKGFYDNVRQLLNVGGLMAYPRGQGGLLLANLLFKDQEAVPANATKKLTILKALLGNLKAPFSGGELVLPGTGLHYTPIDLSAKANQYRTERGWFGDPAFTLADLPSGKQKLAGVVWDIYHFATSPVPEAIMLGGPGVPNSLPDVVTGIEIGQKADALFFLQTARVDQPPSDEERREGAQVEIARYVVHYEDGTSAIIPITAEVNVDSYKQTSPRALPGAELAWVNRYEGTEFSAVVYCLQWTNPRPDEPIVTVDLTYPETRRGVPALLALTAAKRADQGQDDSRPVLH